jgi:hypothetical protein
MAVFREPVSGTMRRGSSRNPLETRALSHEAN